jgi:hypothetical protein
MTRTTEHVTSEIGLAAASYAETGLAALRDGDLPRAIGALASIDEPAWQALNARFPGWLTPQDWNAWVDQALALASPSASTTSTPDVLDVTWEVA